MSLNGGIVTSVGKIPIYVKTMPWGAVIKPLIVWYSNVDLKLYMLGQRI